MSIIRNLILATTLLGLAATASAAGRDHTSDKKQPRDWTGIYIKEDQANRGAWTGAYIKGNRTRSEEHTSELQSLMRISYAVFCLNKKKKNTKSTNYNKSQK